MIRISTHIVGKRAVATFCVPTANRGITILNRLRPKNVKEHPVATYASDNKITDDAAQRSILSVDECESSPQAVSSGDGGRSAIAFDKSIAGKMTPTMNMFTLEGKVALVTGYVFSIP